MTGNGDSLPELPRGWVWTRVGDIYDIVGGGTPSTKVERYWDGDIPWITSADIHGLRDIRPRRRITEAGIENSATNLVPAGSIIVVTRVGLGKLALTNQPLCFSQDSQALVGNNGLVFPDYSLYYLSQAVQIFRYRHRGTTIAGVTKKQLSELPFGLPPLAEQRRIVAKIEEFLTQLDAGVVGLDKAKAQLQRYRQAVLKAATEGELTKEWREAHKSAFEPASVLLERISQKQKQAKGKSREYPEVDSSELAAFPPGWAYLFLEDMAAQDRNAIRRGPFGSAVKKEYFVPAGYKVYEQRNVIANDFTLGGYYIGRDRFGELKRFELRSGDIVITCSGTIGEIAIAPRNIQPGIINQALLKITLDDTVVSPEYFVFLFKSKLRDILRHSTRGSAMKNISSVRALKRIPFRVAPVPEQQRIVEEMEHRLSIADEMERVLDESVVRAERLRQSILKRAFEGKLVPQDPRDEPASVLLERIQAERARREAEKPRRSTEKKTRARNRKKKKPQ